MEFTKLFAFVFIVLNVVYFSQAYPSYEHEQQPVQGERSFESYDLGQPIDLDTLMMRLIKLRGEMLLERQQAQHINSNNAVDRYNPGQSAEDVRPKRGRQCLWKICSWSLEKNKKNMAHN